MNPEVGRSAAEETKAEIQEAIKGADMVFIAGGMGGGTGTGASPTVAQAAKESGILTIGVVTKPFGFEGEQRRKIAEAGVESLEKEVDALITIPNDRLLSIAGDDMSFKDAFVISDDILKQAVESITGTLTNMAKNGLVKNRDDIIAALQNAGFEIARQTPKSISIKSPQGGQNIRLKGAIYESSFRAGADLRVELEAANRAYQAGREQRIQDFKQVYQDGSEKKRERNEKRYSRAESAPLEPVQTNKNSAIDRILAARFSSGNAVFIIA